jgi:hypothetical protein
LTAKLVDFLSPVKRIATGHECVLDLLGLMRQCRYGRHQLLDPEGNFNEVAE